MKIIKRCLVILLISVLVLSLAFMGVYFYNESINDKVVLTAYDYYNPEIPQSFDGYKIFMISDLHNAPFSDDIIRHAEKTNPDIIVFCGDMVQLPDDDLTQTISVIRKFKDDIPIYAVSGNHERQNKSYWDITGLLWDEGVIMLEDDSVAIERGEDSFLLLGVADPQSDTLYDKHYDKIREEINEEFPDGPCFSVLLSHRADIYPEIKKTRADLILSGHLHGGVVRLPFVGGVFGRTRKVEFPKYDYGFFEGDNSADMIVSGGCDKNPKKKRIFNPPEVVLITLKCKEK